MKGKLGMIVVGVVCLAAGVGIGWFFLGSREPAPVAPDSYTVDGVTIPALTVECVPKELELDSLLAVEPGAAPAAEADEESEESAVVAYQYDELEAPVTQVQDYVALLTGEEQQFQFVDDRLFRGVAPAAYEPVGEVYLAQEQPGEERSVLMKLVWDEAGCTVALESVPDRIHEEGRRFSSMETITYLRQLEPAQLGLPGTTMEEYRIYTMTGGVLVDGRPCIPVNIYHVDPVTGTNEVAGFYYLASDERRIYREDPDSGQLREILPKRSAAYVGSDQSA